MGYHSNRRRHRDQRVHPVEIALVLLVAASIVALVVWMIATAGGGALLL